MAGLVVEIGATVGLAGVARAHADSLMASHIPVRPDRVLAR